MIASYADEAIRIRNQIIRAASAIHRGEIPALRIGFSCFVNPGVLECLSTAYGRLFPGCAIHFAGGNPRQILGRMERRELDGALLPMPIEGNYWAVELVASASLVVCLRADDSLAQSTKIPPSDLAERLKIFRDPDAHPHAHARLTEMLAEIGIEAQVSHLAAKKYESQGGPGIAQIVGLLRERSSEPTEDVNSFLDAVIFNWLIAGTDAHAKNYALLLGARGAMRLAPFYDLASVLPYRSIDPKKAKLAMKVGGEYRVANITLRHWRKLAAEIRADEDRLIARIKTMVTELPDTISQVDKQIRKEGLAHDLPSRLVQALVNRARDCQRLMDLDRSVLK